MNLFKRSMMPKEIKAVLGVLDELELEFTTPVFKVVREPIERALTKHQERILQEMQEGVSARSAALQLIANFCRMALSSGHNHIYRGVLNSTGEQFLALFDKAVETNLQLGHGDAELAAAQKECVRNEIAEMG